MFDWLFEGRPAVYLLLGAAVVAFLALWWRHRRRRDGIVAALLTALVALYAGLNLAIETGREQIEARVTEMAASVAPRDLRAADRYFSDSFRSPGGKSKTEFLDLARRFRSSDTVTGVTVWDFSFPGTVTPKAQPAKGSFQVKLNGNLGSASAMYYRCEAQFDHDPQLGWRLRSFELFDPMKENERLPFPY